jgi:hypothetical protein
LAQNQIDHYSTQEAGGLRVNRRDPGLERCLSDRDNSKPKKLSPTRQTVPSLINSESLKHNDPQNHHATLQPGTEDATIYFTGNVVSHGKTVGQDNPVLVNPEDLPRNTTKLAKLKNRKRQLEADRKTLKSQDEMNLLAQEIEKEEMENEILRKKITLLEQLKAQDSFEDSGEIERKQFEKMMKDRKLNRTDPTLGHKLHGIGNRGSTHNTSQTFSTEHRSPGSP